MKKRCVIIGAVEIDYPVEQIIRATDFVICADRGWKNAVAHGINPNMIVGDFDSSSKPTHLDADITVLPIVKDDTDTYYIAKYVVENKFTDVLMCGLLGGKRVEHTIANIQTLLFFAKNKINATMIDKYSQMVAIENGEITLPYAEDKFFSVFTLGEESRGVSIANAKYELNNYTINNIYPIGISNEFIGKDVQIKVEDGNLLVIVSNKD